MRTDAWHTCVVPLPCSAKCLRERSDHQLGRVEVVFHEGGGKLRWSILLVRDQTISQGVEPIHMGCVGCSRQCNIIRIHILIRILRLNILLLVCNTRYSRLLLLVGRQREVVVIILTIRVGWLWHRRWFPFNKVVVGALQALELDELVSMPIVSKKATSTLEEPTHPPWLVVELVAGRLYPACHQHAPLVRWQTVVGVPQVAVVPSV
jgi:hypothetical protein